MDGNCSCLRNPLRLNQHIFPIPGVIGMLKECEGCEGEVKADQLQIGDSSFPIFPNLLEGAILVIPGIMVKMCC